MAGEADAEQVLTGVIYDELHRIAEWLMAQERRDHTLQATALVHEAYMRLAGGDGPQPTEAERDRFLGLAARVMRNILVDHARGKNRIKRGGGRGGGDARVALGAMDPPAPEGTPTGEILALHEAMEKLEKLDPRKARLVELRFFGGLDEAQAARVLGIARSTAAEDWRFARAWLAVEMGQA